MKLSTEQMENCQVILNIEVEPSELEPYLEESYHHLAEKYKIPGFRQGKTPRPILEKYLGQGALLEHALEHMVPELCDKAIDEQKIQAIAYPQIEITSIEPVKFKAIVPTMPVVELGDYKSISMTPEEVKVTEKEIETTIEQMRVQKATWEVVTRPVAMNDTVKIDVKSTVNNEEALNEKNRYYTLKENSPVPVPGFAEQLVGMELGKQKEFNITFPADYNIEEMAGKESQFAVTVNEIKERHLPEINDEFARSVEEGVESVDDLHKKVEAYLKVTAESNSRKALEDRIIEQIAKISKVCYPPVMIEQETNRFLTEAARQFGGGEAGLNTFLKSTGKTLDEIKEQVKPAAETKITRSLILGKVSEDAKIVVTDAEIETNLDEILKSDPTMSDDIKETLQSPSYHETTGQILLAHKTFDYLINTVTSANPEDVKTKDATKQE